MNTRTKSTLNGNVHAKSGINFYDYQLNSFLREYRKQELLDGIINDKTKEKSNAYSTKMSYLKDEIKMAKEEALDFTPKKKVTLAFISLA